MKYYKKLRAKMHELEIPQWKLAEALYLTPCAVSLYFTRKIEWRISTIYAVCDCLKIPYTEISEYFPKGGV